MVTSRNIIIKLLPTSSDRRILGGIIFGILHLLGGFHAVHAATVKVRFITFNVDFANTPAEVQADIVKVEPKADIIMFQEAKEVTLDNYLDGNWTVYQVVNQGDAKRGSALAVRNSIVTQVLATGLRFGVDSNGEDMLDRYIVWMDVRLSNGRLLRLMALHMPPQRIAYLQPIMADNFVTFFQESPYPVVVGADWNYTVTNDPYDIEGRTALKPRGSGIDGFYHRTTIVSFDSLTKLSSLNCNSDHDPVQMISDVSSPASTVHDWNLY